MQSKLAQQLAVDLQIDLYSGGLITTIKNLEKKIEQLLEFLHPTHGLVLAAKRSLVHCYSQVPSIGNIEANQKESHKFFFLLFLKGKLFSNQFMNLVSIVSMTNFVAGVGRQHHENMKRMCNEQLEILSKVDPGYPSWKGDILKHLSTATLNLARLVRIFYVI